MEAKLRRLAKKLGYGIQKKDDGYILYDLLTNAVVAGGNPIPFSLTLEELEEDLKSRRDSLG